MKYLIRLQLPFPYPVVLGLILWFASPGSANAAATFNNWSSSGPFPVPSKAVVAALAVAPTSPATVYNGTDGGGIYTMSGGGGAWSAAGLGLKNMQIRGLAVHPVNPTIIYTGTAAGVFKSSDAGASWSRLSNGISLIDVRALAIDPKAPATVYAATAAGVSKSVDNGANWLGANAGLVSLDVRALLIDPTTAPNTLYAATSAGIFQSSDGGANWVAVNTGLASTDVLSLAYAATTPATTIFAGTNGGGLFISTDSGATWTADNAGGPLSSLAVNAILIDNPSAPTLAYAGTGNGLFKQPYSTGTWNNWSAASTGITASAVIHAIANDPVLRTTVYAGTDLGVFRSANGAATWSAVSAGLRHGTALAIKPTDPTVLVSGLGGGGIYHSSDSASSWIATSSAEPSTPTALVYDISGSPVYAGSGSGVFTSLDDGASWNSISSSLGNTAVRTLAWGPGNALHAGTAQGIFVWSSGSATWAPYGAGQPQNTDLTVLAYRSPYLFAGSNGGGVFRSDSGGGGGWTQINSGLTNTVITSLALDASNVYLGTAAGVFRSADNGSTWNAVNSGLTNLNIESLALATGVPAFLTAGTGGGGGFFSTNGGDIWIPMNTGLSDLAVTALAASSSTKKVFAASAGAKIFSLNLSPVCTVTPAAPLPANPINFGAVNISSTDMGSTIFSLQNSGTLPLNVSSMTLGGADSAMFTIASGGSRPCTLATPISVEAGDYCTLSVNFIPTSSGNKTAFLAIFSDAPNQPVTSYLLGKGGYPPVATISSPVSGATVRNPALISGIALDKIQVDPGSDGTGATLVKVEISTDNGSTWKSATKNPTLNTWTQWSYSWSAAPLPLNGPYFISARATDSNGFVQTALSTISLTVDNTPPVTTITAQPKLLDTNANPSFSFSVNKSASSLCQLDAGTSAPCSSPFGYNSSLSDGSHTFSVISTDSIGNVETSPKSYSWVIDTVPPVTSISSFPAFYTQLTGATFAFSANEANSTFQCGLDGVVAACSSPKVYTNLPDGNHTFTVQATDPAGNTAATPPATPSYSWIVDKNNKPTTTVDAPLAPLTGLNYTFTGTAADSVSGVKIVNVSINNGTLNPAIDSSALSAPPWASWAFPWSLPVNGTYTVQAQATDNAGNVQVSPVGVSLVVANPVPVAQLVSPASAALISSTTPRVITGTAQPGNGGLPLQKVQVTVFPSSSPPANLSWTDATGTTNWSFNWQFPVDGNYTVQARALDVAADLSGAVIGNASPVVSANVTIDTAPPVSSITALPNSYLRGRLLTLAGAATDPAPGTGVQQVAISVTDSSGQANTGTANYNSAAQTWVYTSGTLADGTYVVQSSASDHAGNQQANPASMTITIDNVPPVTSITAQPAALTNQSLASFSFAANEPATFTCTLDGAAAPCVCSNATTTSCTQSYSGLGTGTHSFSVLAKDTAGNVETAAKSAGWSIDLVPPTVIHSTPANGTTQISVAGSTLTVAFSKDVDPSTVNSTTFYLVPSASGSVSYNPATRTATFAPSAPLSYTTSYTATVSTGVADLAKNTLASNYSWSFSTDPEGDVNMDGKVDLADALLCLQMATGLVTPSARQLRHGDLAPFKNGKPAPNGKIDASDALIILSKAVGLISW